MLKNGLTQVLNKELWDFSIDKNDIGKQEKWYENFPYDCDKMVVPSCWSITPKYYDYFGVAWYRTYFETDCDNLYIKFKGVLDSCDVYLDGSYLGSHDGSFTDFGFFCDKIEKGKHCLVVRVDNSFNEIDSIPLKRVDWYHYGGIFKDVELIAYDEFLLTEKKIDYVLSDDLKSANVSVSFKLKIAGKDSLNLPVKVWADGKEVFDGKLLISNDQTVDVCNFALENVKLWDVFDANFHYVTFSIGDKIYKQRIGLRKIEIINREFYLNKKKIYFKGVNRHDEHPDWGFSVPFAIIKKDIDIIIDMGCNFVRGSHYPNDEKLLDYCDEKGVLFWEEIPLWGYPEKALMSKRVQDVSCVMYDRMIKRDFHHPSIVVWGLHNEIETFTQPAVELSKKLYDIIKAYDNHRLITYATKYCYEDICFDYADFISVNMYYGWYDEIFHYWYKCMDDLDDRLALLNMQDKPIVLSEFGVEALYGYNTLENAKWSENYQSYYLETILNIMFKDNRVQGTLIWQYCNARSCDVCSVQRPFGFNNKGIVNEYRLPKRAYYTVKKLFEKK